MYLAGRGDLPRPFLLILIHSSTGVNADSAYPTSDYGSRCLVRYGMGGDITALVTSCGGLSRVHCRGISRFNH